MPDRAAVGAEPPTTPLTGDVQPRRANGDLVPPQSARIN